MRRLLILLLVSLNFMVLIFSNRMVYADGDPITVEGDILYQFGTYTHVRGVGTGLITTSVDEETQIFSINGDNTDTYNILTFINGSNNFYTPNELGYVLDPTKSYLVSYEYLEGELISGSIGFNIKVTSSAYNVGFRLFSNNYQSPIHHTIIPANNTPNTLVINNSQVNASNLKFKIQIREMDQSIFQQNDINLFSEDNQTTIGSVTYQLFDGNRVKINGSTGTGLNIFQVHDYLSELIDDEYYIIKYKHIFGTQTGGNTGNNGHFFSIGDPSSSIILDGNTISTYNNISSLNLNKDKNLIDSFIIIKGAWLDDVSYTPRISARNTSSGAVSSMTYNEFIYELNVQKLSDFITLMNPSDPEEFTISFELNGGVFVNGSSGLSTITVLDGETTNPPSSPSREGFTFSGWYQDIALTIEMNWSEPIASNYTLYAKWTPTGSGAGIDIPSEESDSTILIILLIVFGVGAFYLFTKKRRES